VELVADGDKGRHLLFFLVILLGFVVGVSLSESGRFLEDVAVGSSSTAISG